VVITCGRKDTQLNCGLLQLLKTSAVSVARNSAEKLMREVGLAGVTPAQIGSSAMIQSLAPDPESTPPEDEGSGRKRVTKA
jgi:hypothetical protein